MLIILSAFFKPTLSSYPPNFHFDLIRFVFLFVALNQNKKTSLFELSQFSALLFSVPAPTWVDHTIKKELIVCASYRVLFFAVCVLCISALAAIGIVFKLFIFMWKNWIDEKKYKKIICCKKFSIIFSRCLLWNENEKKRFLLHLLTRVCKRILSTYIYTSLYN